MQNKNLLEQAPPLATHIVRSRGDLAKPCLQVVHSGVLASSDSPLTPCPNKCQTCAWHLRRERLQRCLAQKLHWLDFQGCGSLDLGEICQFRPLPIPPRDVIHLPVGATRLLQFIIQKRNIFRRGAVLQWLSGSRPKCFSCTASQIDRYGGACQIPPTSTPVEGSSHEDSSSQLRNAFIIEMRLSEKRGI